MTSLAVRDSTASRRHAGRINPSDVVLAIAVLATSVHGLWAWQIGYSPTRDLVFTYLLTGIGLGFRYWRSLNRAAVILVTIWLVATWIGFLTWLAATDSNIATNTWREWLLASAFLVFGIAMGRQRWPSWQWVFVVLAALLAAYQLLALIFARDRLAEVLSGPGEFYSDRPMSAGLALLLVLGYIVLLARPAAAVTPLIASGAGLFGISAVLSQHRSVWIAAGVALVLLAWMALRRGGYGVAWFVALLSPLAYAVASLVLSATVSFSLLPSGSIKSVGGVGVPEAATNTATLSWRLDMWQSRLTAPRSLMDWLTGGVFGVNPVKWPGTGVMNGYVSGHNMIVDTLTMYGLLGVIVLVGMFWLALAPRGADLGPDRIFLGALLAFAVFYTAPPWSWVVLGVALSAATGRSTAGQAVPDTEVPV